MRTVLTLIILLSLTSPLPAEESGQPTLTARRLINSQGCKACHTLEGAGGTMAGELRRAEALLPPEKIREQLVNPWKRHGNGDIPDFGHLKPEEIEALVLFLSRDM